MKKGILLAATVGIGVLSQAAIVSAADAKSCLELARTAMISQIQEIMCDFKGQVYEKYHSLYAVNGCGNFVRSTDINSAAGEVLDGMRNEFQQEGKLAFCRDAKPYYDKLRRTYVAPPP